MTPVCRLGYKPASGKAGPAPHATTVRSWKPWAGGPLSPEELVQELGAGGAVPCGGLTEQARVPAPAATARASPSLPRAAGHWGRGAPLPDWRGSASCGPLRGRGPPVTEWLISAPSLMGRWFLWWGRGTLVLPSPGGEGPRTSCPSSLAALTHTARSWAPAVCVLSWGSLCGRPLFFGTGQ